MATMTNILAGALGDVVELAEMLQAKLDQHDRPTSMQDRLRLILALVKVRGRLAKELDRQDEAQKRRTA